MVVYNTTSTTSFPATSPVLVTSTSTEICPSFFLQFTHFLFKFRVTQTISKWILYSLIVINRTFLCSCFIVLVSYINAFHIIGKCRSIHLRSSLRSFLQRPYLPDLYTPVFFCIIPPRSSRHIINKCIRCFSGRIDFT